MFGISPEKLLVLLALGFVLLGPEKMPEMARQAVQALRSLRELADGARSQLTSELGPEFADFDVNSLNPRTAIRNALLSNDADVDDRHHSETLPQPLGGEDAALPGQRVAEHGIAAPFDTEAT